MNKLTYEQEAVRSVFGAYINDLKAYSSKPDRPTFRKLEEVRDKAIKALGQQPFINKPCISEGVCREDKIQVLDKIRAEIKQMDFDFGDFYDHTSTIREMILEVIDKYKVESEDVE